MIEREVKSSVVEVLLFVEENKVIDYFQVMRDFDKTQGKKPDDFDIPLKSSEEPDGGVDYLSVSRKWEKYLAEDQSDLIHNGKNCNE